MTVSPAMCPRCGAPTEMVTEGVPAPHHGKLQCAAGHFIRWVGAEMTFERAAGFTMPVGRFKGKTLAEIDHSGERLYLNWVASNFSGSIRRAAAAYVDGAERVRS